MYIYLVDLPDAFPGNLGDNLKATVTLNWEGDDGETAVYVTENGFWKYKSPDMVARDVVACMVMLIKGIKMVIERQRREIKFGNDLVDEEITSPEDDFSKFIDART